MKAFQVNYLFAGSDGELKRNSIVVASNDEDTATAEAEKKLNGKHPFFRISSVYLFQDDRSISKK